MLLCVIYVMMLCVDVCDDVVWLCCAGMLCVMICVMVCDMLKVAVRWND